MAADDEQLDVAAGSSRRYRRPAPIAGQPRWVMVEPPGAGRHAVAAEPGESEAQTKPSRAGRNLPAAIGVGVGCGGLIVASLYTYRPSFAGIVAVAVLVGSYELIRALATQGIRATMVPVLVGGAAILGMAWTRGANGLVIALLLSVCGVLVWRLAEGADGYLRDTGASVFVLLYVPALAGFALLAAHPHDGAARVMAFIVTVVCSDTGGYAAGVLFGRHPMAPVISKAKTWEGFTGSLVACSISGILFATLTFHARWWQGLLFGLAIAATATLGDLGESMIKRDVGVKDMGHLLPGHGGIMDRLDSLLPCAAVAYLVLSGIAPLR
jgi:phosphatidate cytidylyltransferase